MTVTKIADDLIMVSEANVNMYLLRADDGLTLIDTGYAGTETAILGAIAGMGEPASALRTIILTHAHPDHIGSAAAVAAATGARVLIHARDREIAERGAGFRPLHPPADFLSGLLYRFFYKPGATVPPIRIDGTIEDGEILVAADGLEAIHVPGHCAGQVALLWGRRSTLFAADACINMLGLHDPIGFENQDEGRRSQRRLAGLTFERACFGHGKPIERGAAARFQRKWP